MTCEECGGPLSLKPRIWTCWSDDMHDWCDHSFCSGVCRDTWLRRRMTAVCHSCHQRVQPDELEFRWVADERCSQPHHRGCP